MNNHKDSCMSRGEIIQITSKSLLILFKWRTLCLSTARPFMHQREKVLEFVKSWGVISAVIQLGNENLLSDGRGAVTPHNQGAKQNRRGAKRPWGLLHWDFSQNDINLKFPNEEARIHWLIERKAAGYWKFLVLISDSILILVVDLGWIRNCKRAIIRDVIERKIATHSKFEFFDGVEGKGEEIFQWITEKFLHCIRLKLFCEFSAGISARRCLQDFQLGTGYCCIDFKCPEINWTPLFIADNFDDFFTCCSFT